MYSGWTDVTTLLNSLLLFLVYCKVELLVTCCSSFVLITITVRPSSGLDKLL